MNWYPAPGLAGLFDCCALSKSKQLNLWAFGCQEYGSLKNIYYGNIYISRFSSFMRSFAVHGEKNLGLNTKELMSFTRGLLIVRMPQASLAMFAMTSCVQYMIRSLVLKAPTHLRKSLKSVGFIATPRCAKPVKLSTEYFQEIPRDFSVRLLAITL